MNTFECDKDKARANHIKHRVRFTDAARALNASPSLTQRSALSNTVNEERNVSITKLADGRAVAIVWTPRQRNVRLISVRYARKQEREALNAYLEALQ